MKAWTSNDFTGHYPVGTAAVVVAETEAEARAHMAAAIRVAGLDPQKGFTLTPLDITTPGALILCDGNY